MVRAGLCQPSQRGRALEFSFQDLVLLRTAHGLLQADVPTRRVRRALHTLARQLPPDRPLSGIRICANEGEVLVREGHAAWQPESGQGVFVFEVDELARKSAAVVPVPKRTARGPRGQTPRALAVSWFETAVSLEQSDTVEACRAYRQALALDAEMSDAYVNLGRLVHEAGDSAEAIRLYREALKRAPGDPVIHYNLALAFEDEGDLDRAATHYHRALEIDASFADAHFNLGRLFEHLGKRRQALQHLLAYKKLTETS